MKKTHEHNKLWRENVAERILKILVAEKATTGEARRVLEDIVNLTYLSNDSTSLSEAVKRAKGGAA